jgi:hypothetical protein
MPAAPTNPTLRQAVEDAVVRMFVATDERDWATLETCFTDPFTLDMTSMVGGAPATMTPAQVVAVWRQGFEPLDQVHHQIGNLRTTLDPQTPGRARVRCYGTAHHYRAQASDGKTRTFVGTYEIDLVDAAAGWRIERLAFLLKFIDGNLRLEA